MSLGAGEVEWLEDSEDQVAFDQERSSSGFHAIAPSRPSWDSDGLMWNRSSSRLAQEVEAPRTFSFSIFCSST